MGRLIGMVGIQHRFASDPYSLVKESHVAKRTRHADHVGTILGRYKYKSAYGEKDRGRGHGVRCRRNCERHYILVNFQSTSEPTISLHLLHRICIWDRVHEFHIQCQCLFTRSWCAQKNSFATHHFLSLCILRNYNNQLLFDGVFVVDFFVIRWAHGIGMCRKRYRRSDANLYWDIALLKGEKEVKLIASWLILTLISAQFVIGPWLR